METNDRINDLLRRWDLLAVPLINEAKEMNRLTEMHGNWNKADEITADRNEVLAEFATEMIDLLRELRQP